MLFLMFIISSWYLQLGLEQALHAPLHRVQVLGRGNVILAGSLATCKRQILGHDAVDVDGVDARLLEAFSKGYDFRSLVENSTLDETAGPGEDRGDGVGGGLIALLVLTIMASHGTVGGFGLEGLSVWRDEDGGHEA